MFYHRTFPNPKFRIAIWCMGAFVGAWYLATTFPVIFQCSPIHRFWDKSIPGTCIDVQSFLISTAIISIITDLAIVVMPIPLVWQLHLPINRRIGICAIFFLGGIVVLASIVRVTYLPKLATYDPLCKSAPTHRWTRSDSL